MSASKLHYADGQEVQLGDVLEDFELPGFQTSRIVVIVESREAVEGFEIESQVAGLGSGVLVEVYGSNGKHLIHFPRVAEEISLLRRA